MRTPRLIGVALVLAGLFTACTTSRPYYADPFEAWERQTPTSELLYRVFLVGDGGAPAKDAPEPAFELLRAQLAQTDSNAAVVFLGDNLYCCGLSDSGAVRRAEDERRLLAQLDLVKDFAGRVVFIPGNHDWNESRPGGLEAVHRQERFVEDYLGRGNTFLPDNGFPGPTAVSLNDEITLIAIDTEWWLYRYNKSYGDTGTYDLEEDADFLLELDDLLKRNDDKRVIVVGHHPMFTSGEHAGILPIRDHIFPLRKVHPALILPTPIIGSIYPLYVRFNGGLQNLYHPRYQSLRTALVRIFSQHEDLVYASGHEHVLQYFPIPNLGGHLQHHIGTGAASKPAAVGRGRGAAFTAGRVAGYATLGYYSDGSVWMEMWNATEDDTSGELLFRTEIQGPARELVDPGIAPLTEDIDFTDSTVVTPANVDYEAGGLKTFFLGSHHRDAWATDVEVPVLDLGTEAGGLTVGKRGGGQQTISLRLTNPQGHEFVLRSIDKDPSGTVPVNLQGTIATDIVQDQIASIHPYGAFIIPTLAEAAGVYHTNPKVVYVPNDPRLGIYNDLFAGKLAMFEERPNDDMSHAENFGRSSDVVSASRLYREINDDNDHRVDHRAFARARLFDMLLSDWDRHKDQWRWASFEPYELNPSLEGEARTEGKIYRPIPRDRDFAFNKLNGLFPSLAGYFDPKFQDFTESYGILRGLTLNGLHQDRRFISPLERQDFIEIADSLRASLTDDIIDEAVRQWPSSIYALDGAETARLLKIRRDKLTAIAEEYYEFHAYIADVVGSNKHERFEVTRLDDETMRVRVYKTTKDGDLRRVLYDRVFLEAETKEIRLYGLDGNDTFVVEGDVDEGIKVIAIGGPGTDAFTDRSRVKGASKHTQFYDTETGTTWEVGAETQTIRSDDDPEINHYDLRGYQHDARFPTIFFGSNKDDGIFLGGGLKFIHHGFRKTPFATSHTIKANFAAKTLAFNVVYNGHYVDALGPWDVLFDAAYLSPDNIRNFYGLGNDTENTVGDREFYQARLTQVRLAPSVYKELEQGVTLRIGPTLQLTEVDEASDRFVNQPQAGISENTFDLQTFGGVDAEIVLDTRDSGLNPKQGFAWANQAALNVGLRNSSDTYLRLATDLSFYISPSLQHPQVTLAGRIGAAHNVSDFPFYSANTLGGSANLRGYRSTRFAGRTNFYQNLELRLGLLTFSTYLAIGHAGVLGFIDNGRVWTEADDDRDVSSDFLSGYHQGYGGGVWAEFFDVMVLTAVAGFSDDDTTFTLKFGFQY